VSKGVDGRTAFDHACAASCTASHGLLSGDVFRPHLLVYDNRAASTDDDLRCRRQVDLAALVPLTQQDRRNRQSADDRAILIMTSSTAAFAERCQQRELSRRLSL
jgi:hypothetical protein